MKLTKYKKLLFPIVAAVAATIAWALGSVDPAVPGAAWLVVAGVFGLRNKTEDSEAGQSWLIILIVVVITVLVIAVFWDWRP